MGRSAVLLSVALVILPACVTGGPVQRQQRHKLLLVSFDGFRWNYDQDVETPNLDSMAQEGVKARYMTPAFVTMTSPCHFTLVTGECQSQDGAWGWKGPKTSGGRSGGTLVKGERALRRPSSKIESPEEGILGVLCWCHLVKGLFHAVPREWCAVGLSGDCELMSPFPRLAPHTPCPSFCFPTQANTSRTMGWSTTCSITPPTR